jgi:uncharacterized membrane protein YfcA
MSTTWDIIRSVFFAATGAASANLLTNITCRNNYGNLDWRALAVATSIGATLGVRYAKTEK